MSQNLIEKLRTYIEFNEEEERFVSSVFKLKYFAKGEHFLLAGDVCREAAFIESGVFRFYINTDEPISSTGPASSPVLHRLLCRHQTAVFEPHPATFSFRKITHDKIDFVNPGE